MGCVIATAFIVSSSLYVCLLAKEIKIHHHKLVQLQFDSHFNLDTNTKLKVIIFLSFLNIKLLKYFLAFN